MSRPNSAAIAAEQLQEHAELFANADDLASLLANEKVLPRSVVHKLEGFSALLERHFSFEEMEGLFSKIRAAFPHLVQRATNLEAEHRQMRGELRDILETAHALAEKPSCRSQVAEAFAALRARLRAHEQAEHALLYDAYERDLGEKD